ncbi:MAG: bifunctional diguanylate cyclase/phosphodiesterase, partial [Actinomycetota bacterium]|nr:bifunctional diguanylate cyclase/phosphodiesterase [Actinomycetota bacterium]
SLPNRAFFHARVSDALAYSSTAAVMLVDLDHFKEVNDTLGHRTGDKLLQAVADKLCGHLGPAATVARLGGDEFALLLPGTTTDKAMATARELLDVLNRPVTVDDFSLSVEASIGVAMYPDNGTTSGTLLRCADVAMYLAKESRTGIEPYSSHRDQHSRQRLTLLSQVSQAISDDQFILHYQPQLDLATGQIVAVEALIRWDHPQLGLLPPAEFIPLVERSIHMASLTTHVIENALEQRALWHAGGSDLRVAVNVPANNLRTPDFVARVHAALAKYDVPPSSLEIEITESTIMADPSRALKSLRALADLGVHLTIDDFGTGYSSLAYLKQLPVDAVKIDKSFVLNMTKDADDERIVQSIIGLAKNLGLRTVGEGVEEADALTMLRSMGCDLAQGYHIGRPTPAVQLRDALAPAVDEVHRSQPVDPKRRLFEQVG